MSKIEKIKTFFAGEGIQFYFDNGLILSLGFGRGHYGSNYDNENLKPMKIRVNKREIEVVSPLREVEATTVEMAIIRDRDGKFVTKQSGCFMPKELSDDVAGYVGTERLPDVIACVASKSRETIEKW